MSTTSSSSAPRAYGRSNKKHALAPYFQVDARVLPRGLLENGYGELAIAGDHAVAVLKLPPLHRDPFDRMLVAQATVEGVLLLTAGALVAQYPGPIRRA